MRWLALLVVGGCGFQGPPNLIGAAADAPTSLPVDGSAPHGDASEPPVDAPAIPDAHVIPPDAPSAWPCGAMPAAPKGNVTWGNGTTNTTASTIAIGTNRLVVVPPGGNFAMQFGYAIHDTACSVACRDQIEYGFVPGSRVGCVFDATVPKATGAMGNVQATVTAPTTPGVYDLRVDLAQAASCGNGAAWWVNVTPPTAQTLATVCVH